MKVTIEIECETTQEVFQHLTQIRYNLKKKLVTAKRELTEDIIITDNNCYGTHICKLEP